MAATALTTDGSIIPAREYLGSLSLSSVAMTLKSGCRTGAGAASMGDISAAPAPMFRGWLVHIGQQPVDCSVLDSKGPITEGLYVCDGADADLVAAIEEAFHVESATVAIIAPHITGAKLSDGSVKPADEKIDGGPSVLVDAVALVFAEDESQRISKDKPSQDFVSDAFALPNSLAGRPRRSLCSMRWAWMRWIAA